jgi:hypothetical protein
MEGLLMSTVGGVERVPVASSAHAALREITQGVDVEAVLAARLQPRDGHTHANRSARVCGFGLHEYDRAADTCISAVGW